MARTQHLRTSTTVFAVSVVMGAAVLPVGPAFADDIGELATSTFSYSSVDTTSGVIVGGVPRVFEPAHDGWRSDTFTEYGRWGLERKIDTALPERNEFSAWNEAVTIEQGETSSMVLASQIITDSLTRNIVESTVTFQGNSIRHEVALQEMWAGSLPRMRFYLHATLAAGSDVAYEYLSPSALFVSDTSGTHPSVLMHITATDGDAFFASRNDHEQLVSSGDPEVTAYVGNISGTTSDITLHTFLIDSDPCAGTEVRELALSIAADPATHFGTDLASPSSCLAGNTWEILSTSEQPQDVSITLDDRVTTPAGSTRRFSLGGLPSFLTSQIDESTTPATISFDYSTSPTLGNQALTLSSWLETTEGGVTRRSQPMTQLVALTISEPAPEPEPEPLPEPVEVVDENDAPVVAVVSSSPSRAKKERTDVIEVTPSPAPRFTRVAIPAPPEQADPADTPEPDFQLQESSPATPLPADPPQPEPQAVEIPAEPSTQIWATWWLWVLGGLSLIWWAWLGWSARKNPSPQGM